MIEQKPYSPNWYSESGGKRLLDIVGSAIGLALLSPIYVVIALFIKADTAGPVLFAHERVGRGGKRFRIYKFRSMTHRAKGGDQSPLTVRNDPRVTRVGSVLRRSKLDELPQLANVLLGHMSLVGPRPETPDLMLHYPDADVRLIRSVRPGMTDLASIHYVNENDLLIEDAEPLRVYRQVILPVKLQYCRDYIENMSLRLDLAIIARTLRILVSRRAGPRAQPFTDFRPAASATAIARDGNAPRRSMQ